MESQLFYKRIANKTKYCKTEWYGYKCIPCKRRLLLWFAFLFLFWTGKDKFIKWQPEYQAIHKGQLAVPSLFYYSYCYYYFYNINNQLPLEFLALGCSLYCYHIQNYTTILHSYTVHATGQLLCHCISSIRQSTDMIYFFHCYLTENK